MNCKVLQIQKRDSVKPEEIQDRYSIHFENKVFALSDGTTQSFKSEIWSEMITDSFAKSPHFSPKEWVKHLKLSAQKFKDLRFTYSSNFAIKSLEKEKEKNGASATFLGIKINEDYTVDVISCGDSVLFHIQSGEKSSIRSFPFDAIEVMESETRFANTEDLLSDKVDDSFFHTVTLECAEKDTVILASDALGRLLLSNPDEISRLLEIDSFEGLKNFCLERWQVNRLEEDDISALIVPIGDISHIKEIVPQESFRWPQRKRPEIKTQGKNSKVMMDELRDRLSKIDYDINQLNRISRLNKRLMSLNLGLLLISLFTILSFYIIGFLGVNPVKYFFKKSKVAPSETEVYLFPSDMEATKIEEKDSIEQNSIEEVSSTLMDDFKSIIEAESSFKIQADSIASLLAHEIKNYQLELKEAGYTDIEIDGDFGDKSKTAWIKYKLENSGLQ